MPPQSSDTVRPSVSVIIPCYNSELFIEDAVISALNQTYPIERIYCIDDGSTDSTRSILKELSNKYQPVTLIPQSNQGPGHARNKGLNCCSSDYIQFLDSDDFLLPNKIDKQIEILKSIDYDPDLIIGSYHVYHLNEDTHENTIIEVNNLWDNLVNVRFGTMCSNLFKRSSLLQIGGFDTNTHVEDTDLYFRLLKNGLSYAVDDVPRTIIQRHKNCRSNKIVPLQKSKIELLIDMRQYIENNETTKLNTIQSIDTEILRRLLRLYPHDEGSSLEFHDQYEGKRSTIWSIQSKPRVYKLLYYLFGFQFANKISPYLTTLTGYVKRLT